MECCAGAELGQAADVVCFVYRSRWEAANPDGPYSFPEPQSRYRNSGGQQRHFGLQRASTSISAAVVARSSGACFIYLVAFNRHSIRGLIRECIEPCLVGERYKRKPWTFRF